MKPWGSQASLLHFCPSDLPGNRERLAGGQGGGNEPPGRRTEAAKSWYGRPVVPTPPGCTRLCGLSARCRDIRRAVPAIRIRRVALSFGHPSVTSTWHLESTKLRADATGPLGVGIGAMAPRSLSVPRGGRRGRLPPSLRPVPPTAEASGRYARAGHRAAWPSNAPTACAPRRRWPACVASCRRG
jgi:hypothetical protein